MRDNARVKNVIIKSLFMTGTRESLLFIFLHGVWLNVVMNIQYQISHGLYIHICISLTSRSC